MPVPAPLDLVRGRLAELVVHLSDCDPEVAIAAIRDAAPETAPSDHDGRLGLVAAALLRVRPSVDLREVSGSTGAAEPAVEPAQPAGAATER
jgi:hypothetical protein